MMKPGIYENIPEFEYHSDLGEHPSLSASLAKILCSSSPLHCWTESPRLNPHYVREEKEIFDLGTVAHALMLQGIEHACVLDFDSWKTNLAKAARKEARAKGLTPILAHHWDRVQAMVQAGKRQIADHKEASDAFTDGDPEVTIIWDDKASDGTVVRCRGRIDWLMKDRKRALDYKGTGTSVNPQNIGKFAISQGWDIQSEFYLRGLKILTGIEDADFLFVAQEDYGPYAMTIVGMAPPWRWAGNINVQKAIDIWAKCKSTGIWPAYPDRICYPDLPVWAEAALIEVELDGVKPR